MKSNASFDRRDFFKTSAALVTGIGCLSMPYQTSATVFAEDQINVFGPREGYSPQIGPLVSMLDWMRMAILIPVKGMTVAELDYLHDPNANTIGAMLLHLAATETFFQQNTFGGKKWDTWDDAIKKRWDIPSGLGEEARKTIKGNNLEYYTNTLHEVREKTLAELKKRDDKWLLSVEKDWYWGPTNNYCKWFHVCEHESNHNGQVKFIKGRLPGAKAGKE